MAKNELITGADSRPRIHIFQHMGGWSTKREIGRGSVAYGVYATPGQALDRILEMHPTEQAVIILGAVPGAPGEG